MKKIIALLFTIMSATTLFADDKPVRTEGNWDKDRTRSLIPTPARPVVSIDGYMLSIYLQDIISDLSIVITDNFGTVVYQECVSTKRHGETYNIPLINYSTGAYTIALTHHYKYLIGEFEL